jgi:F-type H+-transporting ATPase subunit delta
MPNPRLAARYAKSLIDLSIEKGQLEGVYKDMEYLQYVCDNSREFVGVLKSPIISPDKKVNILEAVTENKISELTSHFSKLLIRKGRESNFPEIVKAFIQQYKDHQGIYTVKLTTATPVNEETKQIIMNKVKSGTSIKNIDLETEVKEEIIGGFVLQIGDHLLDASVAYELNNARKQFQNNDFVYNFR